MTRPWDDLPFSEAELAAYEKAGMGTPLKPGVAPAVAVVDMNRAFSESRFPLGSGDAAAPVIPEIATVLAAARERRVPVVYTTTFTTTHQSVRGLWKGAGGDLGDPLLSSPEAHELPEAIAPAADEPVLEKSKPSAFWQTGLSDVLAYHRVDTLIVCGMSTSGCVRATVVDAFSHNLRVIVPAECVADRGSLSHRLNLFDMHMKYADVTTTSAVVDYLRGVRGPEEGAPA